MATKRTARKGEWSVACRRLLDPINAFTRSVQGLSRKPLNTHLSYRVGHCVREKQGHQPLELVPHTK